MAYSGEHRPYSCSQCGKRFMNPSTLKAHKMIHTGERRFKCTLCGKTYPRSESFKRHTMLHRGERPHKCDICGKAFILRKELNAHMRRNHPEESQYETITFVTAPKKHKLAKTAEKTYKCTYCDKSFSYEAVLNRHILTHKRGKPYKCPVCSKGFDQVGTLEQHMLTHSEAHADEGSPDEDMVIQNGANIKQDSLDQQLETSAEDLCTDGRTHKCWHCETEFSEQSGLYKHITAHICFICHDIFCQLEYLNEHIKTHAAADSTKCLRCGETFSSKSDLLKHLKTHTDKEHESALLNT